MVDTGKTCRICGETRPERLRPAIVVRPGVADIIRADLPSWDDSGWICLDDLQRYRHRYVSSLLQAEKGELDDLEREVLTSLDRQEIISRNPEEEFQADRGLGARTADRIAEIGGSWGFIGFFGLVILTWMLLNSYWLAARPFDPFPFILLNLVLSCLAAVQAPVIMMSQKRQEGRDRLRAMRDYQVNLKAELEIRHLHQKMDHLMLHQWQRLVEIQEIQMELINEVRGLK